MVIGAVAFSVPVALFGSVYMTVLNGLMFWQGFAAYAIVGFLTLLSVLTISAVESARCNTRARGPWG